MIEIVFPHAAALDRAREAFVEISAADDLLRPAQSARRRRPAASEVYAAARESDTSDAVEEELAANKHARRLYTDVLARSVQFAFGTLRAASSGGSAERHGDGCHIRIERSRAEPSQFFVVVQILRDAPTGRPPTSLIFCDDEDHCRRFPLPLMRNGIAQFIAEGDSDLIRLMADPTTRVLLG